LAKSNALQKPGEVGQSLVPVFLGVREDDPLLDYGHDHRFASHVGARVVEDVEEALSRNFGQKRHVGCFLQAPQEQLLGGAGQVRLAVQIGEEVDAQHVAHAHRRPRESPGVVEGGLKPKHAGRLHHCEDVVLGQLDGFAARELHDVADGLEVDVVKLDGVAIALREGLAEHGGEIGTHAAEMRPAAAQSLAVHHQDDSVGRHGASSPPNSSQRSP
jgi:hypothetical protein